jgi:hypothetical protein
MPLSHDPRISGATGQAMLERAGFQGVEIVSEDKGDGGETSGGLAAWADGFTLRLGWFSGWLMIDWSESGVEIQNEFWKRWGAVTQEDMLDITLKGECVFVARRLLERTLSIIRDILLSHDDD